MLQVLQSETLEQYQEARLVPAASCPLLERCIHLGLRVSQILLVIYYSAHIFGCLWWLTSRYQVEESWWVLDGLSLGDSRSTYIASLYWAVTTITTVSRQSSGNA